MLEQKTAILRAYRERISLRGLQRMFGVWRSTVLRWLKAWVESLHETLLPVQATDVLEPDELVSFVAEKFFKRWLWLAMCRRSRQIVVYAILGRYTRKSLSFSRQDAYHSLVTYWFIILHNLTIRSSLTL